MILADIFVALLLFEAMPFCTFSVFHVEGSPLIIIRVRNPTTVSGVASPSCLICVLIVVVLAQIIAINLLIILVYTTF